MKVEREGERGLVVTREFAAPVSAVYAAWTTPDLLKQWWAPTWLGFALVSCEADVQAGGSYRFGFGKEGGAEQMVFFGKYLEVVPEARLVWTNEESDDGQVTTVTFADQGGATLFTMHEAYASQEALDEAMAGMEGGMGRTFEQLDALLATR